MRPLYGLLVGLLALVWQLSEVQSLDCNTTVPLFILRFEPDIYLGVISTLHGLDNCIREPTTIACTPLTLLSNGNTGPMNPDLSQQAVGRQFVAWADDENRYLILVPSPSPSIVSTINLYLYYSPSDRVGVPNFEIHGISTQFSDTPNTGDPQLLFDIINNGQLSQTDNSVQRLTIRFRTPSSYTGYLLRWNYDNLRDTDWFIMSEVSFCNDPLPTYPSASIISFLSPTVDNSIITPQSELFNNGSLTLTCTVSNEGSFTWRWRRGPTTITAADPGTTILTSEATRTSILTIPATSGSYHCDVTYTDKADFFSRTFSVSVFIIGGVSSITGQLDDSVTLTCEVQGHFGGQISFMWRRGSSTPLTNSDKYSINPANNILTAMDNVMIYTLSLTVHDVSVQDGDMYSCVITSNGKQYIHTITLQTIIAPLPTSSAGATNADITSNSQSSTVTSSDEMNPVINSASTTPLVAAIVVVLVLVTIAVVAAILFLLYLIKRNRRQTKLEPVDTCAIPSNGLEHSSRYSKSDIKWEIPMTENNTSTENLIDGLYSSISKDRPPSLPSRHYDDEANDGLNSPSNVYAEVRSRSYTNSTTPKLAKLKNNRPDSFGVKNEENPIYESSTTAPRRNDEKPLLSKSYLAASDDPGLYAEPSTLRKEPKQRKTDSDNIYSVALTPAMFNQQSKSSLHEELSPYGPIYAEPTKAFQDANIVKEITSSNYREVGHLGVGQFGEVVLAETVGLSARDLSISSNGDKNVSIKVAIKMLQKDATDSIRENFEKEIIFMSSLKDDNIIRLLAIGKGEKPFIMMEYMESGDLHQLLNNYNMIATENMNAPANGHPIHVSLLVYAVLQISSGMKYLASRNCVHRDLATRNCLVSNEFKVKIGDFGMSRKLYDRAYYKVKGRAMMPIRWMAMESFYGRFSEETDVWSFGVVMWEIFTLCRLQPYGELDDQEFIQDAVKGSNRQLLQCPRDCPQNVYDVMLKCWEHDSQSRPNFSDINKVLSVIYKNYT